MLWLTVGLLTSAPCLVKGDAAEEPHPDSEPHSTLHKVCMYLPNRVLDILDIVRLRVRVGPGTAVDIRATNLAAAFVGTYATVYVGLPGPRNRPTPKLPFGLENRNGVQASLADVTADDDVGPDYGPAEIGLGVQALIVGFDAGVDPLELLDLAAGIFFIDLRADDL
jgi:hypothetical protein